MGFCIPKRMIDQLLQAFLKGGKVSTDSRTVRTGDIFFGLKGEKFNGNRFTEQAIAKGAILAVTDDPDNAGLKNTILVNDSLKTLQELASEYRKMISIPVIGITGSNGKTTTKELVHLVMKQKFNVFATQGNLNNHIGVPLSILAIKKDAEVAIIEMGANHIGEIDLLCKIARPTHGMITNIGKAHLEGFGSIEGVIKAKSELYDYLRNKNGTVFVNEDDELLMSLSANLTRYRYGTDVHADISARLVKEDHFLEIHWDTKAGEFILETHLFGRYNFYNILAALAVGRYFEVDPHLVSAAIRNYIPQNNRSQLLRSKTNEIYLDAYNANPTSMENALNFFGRVKAENKAVILGDMLELGPDSEKEHRRILDLLGSFGFSRIFLVGEIFKKVSNMPKFIAFENTGQMSEWLSAHPIHNTAILIKGSRRIGLEKLTDQL